MKTPIIYHILTVVLFLPWLCCCTQRNHVSQMQRAYALLNQSPDSALVLLSQINKNQLSIDEKAYYNLVYTIAQDKSGLDVDRDSLLGFAFSYYKSRPDDSLYAKCMYYTGVYYLLNESTKQAEDCFLRSIPAARIYNDRYTEYLALERLSNSLRLTNPELSLNYAKQAYSVYCDCSIVSETNKVYLLMNIGNSYNACHLHDSAMVSMKEALALAEVIQDSRLLGNAYQSVSNTYSQTYQNDSALHYIRKAWATMPQRTESLILALSDCLIKADSLDQARDLLEGMKKGSRKQSFAAYRYLTDIAFRQGKLLELKQHSDSALYALADMYEDLQQDRREFSTELRDLSTTHLQQKSSYEIRILLLVIVLLSLLFILFSIFVSYRSLRQKKEMEENLAKEKIEKQEQILRMKEQQIATMKKYLLQRFKDLEIVGQLNRHKKQIPDEVWEEISSFLDCTQDLFVTRLRRSYSHLTEDDIRFCMLLRLDIPNEELCKIYGISSGSIKNKQRLFKQKLGRNSEVSLRVFLREFS